MASVLSELALWEGVPPGSESWDREEQDWKLPPPVDVTMVRNVVRPTLTPVLPDASLATGTGIVVCPGGGYLVLATEHEGFDVAHWLADRGIAAFVLKYRVMETPTSDEETMSFLAQRVSPASSGHEPTGGGDSLDNAELSVILRRMEDFASIPLADGLAALRLARDRAPEWNVGVDRLGMVGFSAGGYLVLDLALHPDSDFPPAFVGAVYAPCPGRTVPADAPPLFLAAATDDPLVAGSLEAYTRWRQAGRPVEAHLYARGGHGFGMRKQGCPADNWIDHFHRWIASEGFT
jgi:acetyl esterase/lipase